MKRCLDGPDVGTPGMGRPGAGSPGAVKPGDVALLVKDQVALDGLARFAVALLEMQKVYLTKRPEEATDSVRGEAVQKEMPRGDSRILRQESRTSQDDVSRPTAPRPRGSSSRSLRRNPNRRASTALTVEA